MSKSSVGGIIASVLIALVASVGLSAGGFGIGYGTGIILAPTDQGQIQQETTENSQSKQDVQKASCAGPNLTVENGTVTWMSETWAKNGGRSIPGYGNLVDSPSVPKMPPNQDTADDLNQEKVTPQTQDQTPAQNQTQPQGTSQNAGNTNKGGNATESKPSSPQTQTGVKIDPSSQSNKSQNGGVNTGTQSGGDVSSNFAAGKVLITTASDNNKDPVYHTKYCPSAQKIAPNDMRWYDSAEAAEANNRRLCGNCAK